MQERAMDGDLAMSMEELAGFCSCKIYTSYIPVGRIPQGGVDANAVIKQLIYFLASFSLILAFLPLNSLK